MNSDSSWAADLVSPLRCSSLLAAGRAASLIGRTASLMNRSASVGRAASLMGCVGWLTGCTAVEIPEGPDMDSLYEIYKNPTGTLRAEELAELIEEAQIAHDEVEALGALDLVVDTIKPVADSISQAAGADAGSGRNLRFLLSGKGDVEQICPGLMASPTKDVENGSVRYQVALRDNFVLKTIWGTFEQCQFYAEGLGGTFDGTWALSLGTNQLFTTLHVEDVLVQVEGDLTLDTSVFPLERDFLVDRERTIEVRLAVSDGDVICSSDEEGGRVSIRTREGAFCCILTDQECYALDGNTCESADAGGKRIRW